MGFLSFWGNKCFTYWICPLVAFDAKYKTPKIRAKMTDDRCRSLINQRKLACMLQDNIKVQYNSNQTNKKFGITNYSL